MGTTPEGLVKKAICEWLRLAYPALMFWLNDSKGTWDPRRKIFLKKNSRFDLNGVSDILGILAPWGVLVAIEVKSKTGRLRPDQAAFLAWVKRAGGIAIEARSIEDVDRGIKEWLAEKRNSAVKNTVA